MKKGLEKRLPGVGKVRQVAGKEAGMKGVRGGCRNFSSSHLESVETSITFALPNRKGLPKEEATREGRGEETR